MAVIFLSRNGGEIRTTEGPPLAIMAVDAVASDGKEYEVYYHSDFKSFKHFLSVAESMIKSFRTTEGGSNVTDFSLSGPTGSSNITGQQSTNSSGEDDFSLS